MTPSRFVMTWGSPTSYARNPLQYCPLIYSYVSSRRDGEVRDQRWSFPMLVEPKGLDGLCWEIARCESSRATAEERRLFFSMVFEMLGINSCLPWWTRTEPVSDIDDAKQCIEECGIAESCLGATYDRFLAEAWFQFTEGSLQARSLESEILYYDFANSDKDHLFCIEIDKKLADKINAGWCLGRTFDIDLLFDLFKRKRPVLADLEESAGSARALVCSR